MNDALVSTASAYRTDIRVVLAEIAQGAEACVAHEAWVQKENMSRQGRFDGLDVLPENRLGVDLDLPACARRA